MTTPDPAPPNASPWTSRGFIAAAVIVAVIVVAGVLIAVLPSPGADTDADTAKPSASATGSASPAPLATAIPTAAPADVTWTLLGSLAVPQSKSAGPQDVSATTASGYAHTPIGALVAAVQLALRSGITSPVEVGEQTVTRQFLPGADRDRMLAALRQYAGTKIEPGEAGVIAGFSFNTYTPDTAVVSLAVRLPSAAGTATYQVITASLQWRDGDWQMVAPPGGEWKSVVRAATDLSGFIEWGPR